MERKSLSSNKGSRTALVAAIRKLEEYEQWKRTVFIRDRFQCQHCGARNGRKRVIEADHIIGLALLVRENGINSVEEAKGCLFLWDTDNGRTLCRTCHQKTPSYPKNFCQPQKEKKPCRKN